MNRPSGWLPNCQALATVSLSKPYAGHPDLGSDVDADTWLTPLYILSRLGSFDLDPCATEKNRFWCAPRSFVRADDGLTSEWAGRVFMNPPFSNSVPWLQRHAEYGIGISLVPASVESRVWREFVWPKAKAILLLHGRTRFCNPDGSSTQGRPLRSIALIAWSDDDAAVLKSSGLAGVLLTSWAQV